MILTNLMDAKLYQYNRGIVGVYDDEDIKEVKVKICPYNADTSIKFGIYTDQEDTGYYIVKGNVDIREGDQIEFRGERHTIMKVKDNWIFNKIVNMTILIK